jgi:uncharacterized membrane protein
MLAVALLRLGSMKSARLPGAWRGTLSAPALLITVLIINGVFFRFAHLGYKAYWMDEVFTSIYLSGHTFVNAFREIQRGEIVSLDFLLSFQFPTPGKTVFDMVASLGKESAMHPPLYYALAHFWNVWFGNSVTVTRSFSAIASLFAFPCIYWLCRELFGNPTVGWMAIAITAVSPLHLVYAQEARQYMHWIVITTVVNALLLRAIRLSGKPGSQVRWLMYSLGLSLALYIHIFSVLLMASHFIYCFILYHPQWLRLRRNDVIFFRGQAQMFSAYSVASVLGVVLFLPWIWVIYNFPPDPTLTAWMNEKTSTIEVLSRWAGLVSRSFVDFGISPASPLVIKLATLPIIFLTLLLISYSLIYLCQNTSPRVWLFLILPIAVTGTAYFLPDLLFTKRSGTTRYILPALVGIQLSVSYLLATKLQPQLREVRQNFWRAVTGIILTLGLVSYLAYFPSHVWWNKGPVENGYNVEIANLINAADHPLLISDGNMLHIFTLSHLLQPKVDFLLFKRMQENSVQNQPLNLPSVAGRSLFLLDASDKLREDFQTEYNLEIQGIMPSFEKLVEKQR